MPPNPPLNPATDFAAPVTPAVGPAVGPAWNQPVPPTWGQPPLPPPPLDPLAHPLADPLADPFAAGYHERFADPQNGRTIATVWWDRQWTMVRTDLRSGPLPIVRDLTLFEHGGLATPSPDGQVVVRINRSMLTPHFAVTLNGRPLMPMTQEQLPPAIQAELAKPTKPLKGTSTQALIGVVAGIVGLVVAVIAGVIALTRIGTHSSSAPTTFATYIPSVPLPTFAPYPGSTIPSYAPPTFASVSDRLAYEAEQQGAPDSTTIATCMLNTYPDLSDIDIDYASAKYRSGQYKCMPETVMLRWRITASGIAETDKPCANLATIHGLGNLTLADVERTMPFNDTARYPVDIQDQLIAVVKSECPQIPPDVAERVVKE
jgi:hypothetical protein